jgi:YesN/AraC family two-component response regulator
MGSTGENHRRSTFVKDATLSHWGIKRAVEFIHQHYQEKLSLAEIAAQACLSKYYFSRLFHRVVGIPYQEYVNAVRIEKAKELLTQTPCSSITQIGYEIGFGGLRNFESHFKKLTGYTPYEYRIARMAQHRSHNAQDESQKAQFHSRLLAE